MPRAHWKGYLKLSLVSCPISLFPAISAAERISFRQVNRQTGNRLRHQMVDSVTGEVVAPEHKGRGYEVAERQLVLVEDEELEAAQQQARTRPFVPAPSRATAARVEPEPTPIQEAPRAQAKRSLARHVEESEEPVPEAAAAPAPVRVLNNRTIEIERCVPREEIDPRYFDTPYYVAPRDDAGQEAFAVIRDALDRKELVGLGHVVLAKRERPIVVYRLGNGIAGMTLRYAHEVRSETEYFASIPELDLPAELLEVAEHILELKAGAFDPTLLEDRYRSALVSMLKEKQVALPQEAPTTVPSSKNVINLMEALKRSLATERPMAASKPIRMPRAGSKSKAGGKAAGRKR